jgi:hypothetical protein
MDLEALAVGERWRREDFVGQLDRQPQGVVVGSLGLRRDVAHPDSLRSEPLDVVAQLVGPEHLVLWLENLSLETPRLRP